MTFTEYDFLIFFLVFFSAYWLIKRKSWQNLLLLAASYIFYGWVHPWYALMLGLSTLVDYALALGIARNRARTKWYMALSLLFNLGVLCFFKYYNFFNEGLFQWLTSLGIQADVFIVRSLLPAGLSFYTLKKLAYMFDVSRGTLEPSRDLVGFGLFAAFFPQINAGPIDRAQKLLPQIQSERTWKADYFYNAWPLIVMGFFKKVVIADTIANYAVIPIFNLQHPTPLMLGSAALAFTVQILADFSAYTDLSRGVALLFGFETSENFNAPYQSLTPTEFWNRWHITLSTWLRDYIFFPLRRTLLRSKVQLPAWLVDALPPLVTMLVSGIWHGVGWTYVLWGGFYGVLIVLYQALGLGGSWKPSNWLTRAFAWLVMFSMIVVSFAVFRASSLQWLTGILTSGLTVGSPEQRMAAIFSLSIAIIYSLPLLLKWQMERKLPKDSFLHEVYFVAATILMLIYINSTATDFVYFQF
jgi:D-alanyl-lipoteichoic acid acyltransferase DltB (MBOAT superfamily)